MKIFRKLLFPFSLVYGSLLAIRNYSYDKNWLKSKSYSLPIICVGNLSTGGTGKSPMIEYLISFLENNYQIAVLSRGYKRKTSGFIEVLTTSKVEEVGDEPLQFKKKFPKVVVAVCANRQEGIDRIKTNADIILLDDAFQHRKVNASKKMLLTSYNNLYINDCVLPAGNLRELKSGAKRADIIVVTKCPEQHSFTKLKEIEQDLNLLPEQKIYFSKITYDKIIYGISENLPLTYLENKNFTLVTGIADSSPLLKFLNAKQLKFNHKKFSDHHHFSNSEINNLKESNFILTTEKDFVRLQPRLPDFPIYYLPIKTSIVKGQEASFKREIIDAIVNFS